jgi:ABC-type phosphate transport system substrate-binding protein
MKRFCTALAIGAACMLLAPGMGPPVAAQGEAMRIVVHESNAATSITKAQLSRLFLKKVTTWDNGTPVVPVDQPDTAAVRESFSTLVHGRSVAEVKAYWQRMIFSGRSLPPAIKGSDREVIEFVRTNPGGIGYVSTGAGASGVKVLDLKD